MPSNPFAVAVREMTPTPQRALRGFTSVFGGASTSRNFQEWNPWTFSPDYEVRYNLRLMRARARQLVRDNPYATGFATELANNVVGPDGVMLQAKIRTATGQLVKATNDEIERGWAEWSDPENASADGKDGWIDVQRMAIQMIGIDGEMLLRIHRGFDNPFGFALQFIDPDLLDETWNVPPGPTQNEVRMGVEIDRFNRPVAYHVWNSYPTEPAAGLLRERVRIPASDILHRFIRYRPNQTRGMTLFAPIMSALHMLDGYESAELQASRVSAAKMGWIVNKSETAIQNFDPPESGEQPRTMDVEPGLISQLLPGEEFQSFDPSHPNTAYRDFTTTVLRAISRGLGVSYSTLTGDLKETSYSSIRAGILPERDHYRRLQMWFSTHICRPIYREWLQMALLSGAIELDSRLSSNYQDVAWKPRGWKWVDPRNDAQAAKLLIDLGLDSRTRMAAEHGRDYEEIVDDLAQEEAYAEENGVDVSGNQITGLNPSSVSPEGLVDDKGEPHDAPSSTPTTPPKKADGSLRLIRAAGGAI